MISRLSLVPVWLVLASTLTLSAGDAPTAIDWAPVAAAIDNKSPDAIAKVRAIVTTYPTWIDGHRTLASLLARQGDFLEAYRSARNGLKIVNTDMACAEIAVLALARLGKIDEAVSTAKLFSGSKDPQGRISYQAAMALLDAGKAERAGEFVAAAMARNPKSPENLVLDGRLKTSLRQLEAAEASFTEAVNQDRTNSDAWYLLGLVRLELVATATPAGEKVWLAKSRDAFKEAVALRPNDPDSLTGLGKAQLELSKRSQGNTAGELLAGARTNLILALQSRPDSMVALLFLGEARLRNKDWSEAAQLLDKAYGLGATDQQTVLMLVQAHSQAGNPSTAAAFAEKVVVRTTAERLILGLQSYENGSYAQAAQLLAQAAIDSTTQDNQQIAAILRVVGHAERKSAASLTGPEAEAALDRAREAYLKAGEAGDFSARHWYLANEAGRTAEAAHNAARMALTWDPFSGAGWSTLLATYPQAATGGEGLGGWWQRHPLHVILVALLIVIPLTLFIRAWRRQDDSKTDADAPTRVQLPPRTPAATGKYVPKPAAKPSPGMRPARPPAKPIPPPITTRTQRVQKPGSDAGSRTQPL